MRNHWIFLAGTLAGLTSPAVAAAPNAEANVPLGRVSNQYICTFDSSVSAGNVRAEAARAAGPSLGTVIHTYEHAIRGFAVRLPAEPSRNQIADLKANNSKISSCEQDQYVKALIRPGKPGGGGGSTGQETPWGITRVGGPGGTADGTAWVIDTGIDLDHPDLAVDASRSRSFIRDSSPDDANGHGTHVAGTIAACNNSVGVVGVAPCSTVVAVRVLDRNGRGTWSGVVDGIDYVAANGGPGDVANMSLGGGASDIVDDAVIGAAANGIKFALAAGNDGDDANNYSPARANGTNVYTVSAFASGDNFASWSNYGNPPVDWAEPGVSIKSTYKGGGYATLSGTSMAAPHLAGILLLGNPTADGSVNGDPDGDDDPIGHR